MNVFGKNERSWRKARKRGVSPIIATILLVAITVVLAAVLYVLISGLTGGGVGSKPIGTAFAAGNPIAGKCGGTSPTFATNGCKGGDYVYNLTVETTGATFANVLWEVKTSSGGIFALTAAGGFSIMNIAGVVVAQAAVAAAAGMAMTASFSTFSASATACNGVSCSSSTPFSSIYTITLDMGTANPQGQGLSFVTVGTAGYSGTTSLPLP
jgi:flagellin-like protein